MNTLRLRIRTAASRLFAAGCLLLSTSAVAPAQPAPTGTITGRVYNPAAQEYVRNAEVRIEGSDRAVFTESDGSFQFDRVPAGEVAVTVSYSGYNTVRHAFIVTAGQTAVREINLVSTLAAPSVGGEIIKMSAFTVSSEREGNAKAVMDQRRNMDITTSVSSDIFGDVTDGNVGEFLKYLPGVDLDYVESEARGPRLGGMEAQYVGVSFDGIRTASADANRGGGDASRATSFEGFSITAIESIEISRTTSAESDADSPAGTINMKTRRAFMNKGRRINYNTSLNFNSEEMTLGKTWGPDENRNFKWKPNYQFDYSESFLNQRLGILFSASRANSYTEQYSFTNGANRNPTAADPRPLVIRQIQFKDGPKFILKDSLSFTADYKATPRLVLSFTGIYTYAEGDFWNRNLDFVAANDNANVNNGRSRVGGDGILTVSTNRATNNTVPAMNITGGTSTKLTYTRTFAPKFEYKSGPWMLEGSFAISTSRNNYEALERGFSENENLNVPSDWIATRPHPMSWEWTIRQTSGNDWFSPASWAGGTRVENSSREWLTEIWAGKLNATWNVPFMQRFPTQLKFGGKWNEEYRNNNNNDAFNFWRYIGPGGDVLTGYNATTGVPTFTTSGNWSNLGYIARHEFDTGRTNALTVININGERGMPPRADRNKIGHLFRDHPELFVRAATADNYYNSYITNKRDFLQTVTAGFTQMDIRLASKISIRGGVRWEETKNALTEWDPRSRDEVIAAGFPVNTSGRATSYNGLHYQYQDKPRVTRESKYHNWFPSYLLKYKVLSNLEFQAGFNKAIGRAPIDDLTGFWNFVEDASGATNRIDAPNPALLPEHHKNYQARLAYYFGSWAPGQLSVQVSQNDTKNLREDHDFTPQEFGLDDPDLDGYIIRSTRNSVARRRNRNMEVAYNQTLGFLPEQFRGTSFNLAYTRAYASSRRGGLAPHRLTSRLGYAYHRFNGQLGMVWIDRRPESEYGRYRPAHTTFDLNLNWRLNSHATIYVQGRNITGQPQKWYQSPQTLPEGTNAVIRQYQEYGSNWVFGVKGTF